MWNGFEMPVLVLGVGVLALAVLRALGLSGVFVFAAGAGTRAVIR